MTDSPGREKAGKRPGGLPIAHAILGGIGGLVLVAVALVFVAGYEVARRNTTELIRDKAELIIDSIIERTRAHLDPAQAQIVFLAGLMADEAVDLTDTGAVGELLTASLAAVPQVSVVAFVDPEVTVVRAFRNRPDNPVVVSDWSNDPYFQRTMAEVQNAGAAYWGELFVVEDTGETFINIRVPLRRQGRFAGALIAGVSIADLSRFLDALGGDHVEKTFILSGQNSVLAHPTLLNGFPGLSDIRPLPTLGELGDAVLAELWTDEQPARPRVTMRGGLKARTVDLEGETYVVLFRALAGYGKPAWLVGSYAPLESAGSQLERLGLMPWIGLGILAVALALAVWLGRGLSRPILELAVAARQIRHLNLQGAPTIGRSRFREVNEAASAFNAMIRGLRWFETYVPRSLVRRLMARGGEDAERSEEREVTVLFTDIVGFTAFAEEMPAPAVAAFLNEHFTLVAACIEAEGGTVDKYMGDALMAFWGAPDQQPDHAERACRAALAIARAVEADNAKRRDAGLRPIGLRIGMHSGPVIVGNIGAPGRVNYTIIGDVVNTAERLEGLARELVQQEAGVATLISGDTAARVSKSYDFLSVGSHHLRGRHEPVTAFRLKT
ncbi:MAG: hypothetical protein MI806_25035 [Minwuiales bacterium]|nr:hypothetical protein [Minwuiales bacterium]